MTTYSDSYWNRREEADEERERQATPLAERPEFGPVEPPPPEPPDVAPTPPGVPEPGFDDFPGATAPAPVPPADDGMKAQRLKAIDRIRQLGETEYEPPAGLRDSDLAAASSRDREQVQRDNFTAALASAISRRPARMQSLPSEAGSLTQRRATADAAASRKTSREMDANARLAAALRGETPKAAPALTPYQQAQLANSGTKRAYDEEQDRIRQERHNQERGEDMKFRDEQARRADDAAKRQDALLSLALRKDKDAQTQGLPANMELEPGANPAPEQLKDLGTVDRGADEVHRLANRMRTLLAESSRLGRAVNPNTVGAFKQIQGEMTLALKDAGKLGQISAGDQSLIDAIRPEATGLLANVMRDPASFEAQLSGMERYAEDKRGAAMKSMGVRRRGGAADPTNEPSPVRPPSPGKLTPSGKPYKTKQVSPSTGAIRYLDERGGIVEETKPSRPKAEAAPSGSENDEETG